MNLACIENLTIMPLNRELEDRCKADLAIASRLKKRHHMGCIYKKTKKKTKKRKKTKKNQKTKNKKQTNKKTME